MGVGSSQSDSSGELPMVPRPRLEEALGPSASVGASGRLPNPSTQADTVAEVAGETDAALWTLSKADQDAGSGALVRRLQAPQLVDERSGRDDLQRLQSSHLRLAGTTDWWLLIGQWRDWDADTMARIIECESGGDENAVSPDGQNVGAYQLNVVHGWTYEQMTDPIVSTDLAHDLWLSSGYEAWACY